MAKKNEFNKQFKPGQFPDQHWDESVRTNGPEVSSPTRDMKKKGEKGRSKKRGK